MPADTQLGSYGRKTGWAGLGRGTGLLGFLGLKFLTQEVTSPRSQDTYTHKERETLTAVQS